VSPRARAAVPLIVTYWIVLGLGLGLYTAARTDAPGMLGVLWGGCIFGTLVGHVMGMCDIRLWFTALIVGALVLLGLAGPSTPDTKLFWMTFTPAAISAALSVTDRWSLASFWFPAMIWMLTVLDGTHGKASPDGTAAVLLGVLAFAFILFLRARESRRVGLWRITSTAPLAAPSAANVFKEPPGKELGRAGWMLATSAIVFGFTAWLAPHLWQVETFAGDPQTIAANGGPAGAGVRTPCCEELIEAERSRVKEYFDFGRGKDALSMSSGEPDCRKCSGDGGPGPARAWRNGELVPLYWCTDHEIEVGICVPVEGWAGVGGYYNGGGGGGGGGTGGYGTGGYGTGNGYGTGTGGTGTDSWANTQPSYEPQPQPYVPPTVTPEPRIEPTPRVYDEFPKKLEPLVEPPKPTPPPVAPPVEIPNVRPEPPAPTVTPPAPTPAPAVGSAPSKSSAPSPAASRTQKPASTSNTGELLRWLSAFIAAVIALQLLRFLFRPLRRAIALRHLRKPFWEETVDQRVSNWWQLVLVGLRDAGWRTSADEAPRDFARRVGIDGVDKCASILDRTRHGIRVDQDDLDEMARSAEAAYRSARNGTGSLARAAAQIRWPLA
jgi:hypothetical protein